MDNIQGKITAYIVDDEEKSVSNLEYFLNNYCSSFKVIGTNTSSFEALSYIRSLKPKLLFLDINMPKINGFELLKLIDDIDLIVVFVTAHSEFAIKAIKNNAFDYLLKPISIKELLSLEKKIIQKISNDNNLDQPFTNQRIIFSLNEGHVVEDLSNITYFKSENNYTHVFREEGKKILLSKSLKHFEESLKNTQFHRVNNSFLINILHVKRIIKGSHVEMSNGVKIEISRRRINLLNDKINLMFKKL